ncbi:MAG: hydrogenase nickel incorporation protein HypB [Anaerolineales bacterium]|nr:hydrogenase nickel incorporation protein HypB [Anaerolineales bacterium]
MVKNISIIEDIQEANDTVARTNRQRLDQSTTLGINLMASPGAGKTTLIENTLQVLAEKYQVAVIDGDIATSIDADRAEKAGAFAVQINTGGACHIDANMLRQALDVVDLGQIDLVLVENVGNLICPASFQLGTHKNVLIASIPEGDDKPYKYPPMYRDLDALVINKMDLLPYVDFDLDYFRKGVEILSPGLVSFPLSCQTGEGLDPWLKWLEKTLTEEGI